jgi:hypothetical protein
MDDLLWLNDVYRAGPMMVQDKQGTDSHFTHAEVAEPPPFDVAIHRKPNFPLGHGTSQY